MNTETEQPVFIFTTHDDAKQRHQSHECHVTADIFVHPDANCTFSADSFGATPEEARANLVNELVKFRRELEKFERSLTQ